MEHKSGTLIEWLVPSGLIACTGWVVWHMPAFLLDLLPYENESLAGQVAAIHERNDYAALPGLFGGTADALDWLALILIPLLFVLGIKTVGHAKMEFEDWRPIDRVAIFVGRVTMILIALMTIVMLYEVFVRYVLNAATIWANELSLWLAGFIFLMSGLYSMQQRAHIRIFLLYDMVPRWLQRTFDCISTGLIVIFAFALVYGSYKQVFVNKLYKWETFGTAFDPPLPATLQPMILIVVTLVAIQAVLNLIHDWNAEPTVHTAADDIDEDELEALKRSLGTK